LAVNDEADDSNAIIEIRAATGGLEAALFAADLFQMYKRYASHRNWKFEALSFHENEVGGFKEAIASIVGAGVFGEMKLESGVHRVQRVPITESDGRVHTSTATVAILPQPEEIDIVINKNDIKFDTFRAQGAGGQHVNTTDSAVRLTHIPTGMIVAVQEEKSQHRNKAKAIQILQAKLFDEQRQQNQTDRVHARRQQIGTGARSERIRTYNYQQDRITDHRINMSLYGIDDFLSGNESLNHLMSSLLEENRMKAIRNFLDDSKRRGSDSVK
ncbi:uncharacterized protein TRIADDRAFT_31311, partial [Trichoplax adhaerens]